MSEPMPWREPLRVAWGAALGIFVTGALCHAVGTPAWPWLVAPMGASAVLIFAAPANPMSRPAAVVGGHAVSAAVGIALLLLAHAWPWALPPALSAAALAAFAVGSAIAAMFLLRCLHPPGGATALLVVLSGVSDPRFALFPVLANAALLVVVGLATNRATRREPAAPAHEAGPADDAALDADLDAVLARHHHTVDIGRAELKALLEDARLRAYRRKLADIRCADIMSKRLITVARDTSLHEAQALLRAHRIKALPVLDANGRVEGIVTPADFVRATANASSVGQIMSRKVRVASSERHLVDLVPLFGSSGHHHIPIVDAGGRLAGIVTQSDVVAALCRDSLDLPPRH